MGNNEEHNKRYNHIFIIVLIVLAIIGLILSISLTMINNKKQGDSSSPSSSSISSSTSEIDNTGKNIYNNLISYYNKLLNYYSYPYTASNIYSFNYIEETGKDSLIYSTFICNDDRHVVTIELVINTSVDAYLNALSIESIDASTYVKEEKHISLAYKLTNYNLVNQQAFKDKYPGITFSKYINYSAIENDYSVVYFSGVSISTIITNLSYNSIDNKFIDNPSNEIKTTSNLASSLVRYNKLVQYLLFI